MQMHTPDANSVGLPKSRNMELGKRTLRTMDDKIANYPTGESGAELGEMVGHCERESGGYGLVNEEFLDELHTDPTKIVDLMRRLGETRDDVSIVARTADGKFTRLFVHKEGNTYKETERSKSTEQDSTKKTKTHRQEGDLFVFEKGAKSVAA